MQSTTNLNTEKNIKKNINNIFENNFVNADQIYDSEFKDQLSKNEYDNLKIKFITKWFKENYTEQLQPNKEQCLVIADHHKNTIVTARAGSGKTTTMVYKVIFMIKHLKYEPSSILMLAFNRKAMFNMKEKITLCLISNEEKLNYLKQIQTINKNEINTLEKYLNKTIKNNNLKLPQIHTFHSLAYKLSNPFYSLSGKESLNMDVLKFVLENHCNDLKFILNFFKLSCFHFHTDYSSDFSYTPYRSITGHSLKTPQDQRLANYLLTHGVRFEYVFNNFNPKANGYFKIINQAQEQLIITTKNRNKIISTQQSKEIKPLHIEINNIPDNFSLPIPNNDKNFLDSYLEKFLGYKINKFNLTEIFKFSHYAKERFLEITEKFICLCFNNNLSDENLTKLLNENSSKNDLNIKIDKKTNEEISNSEKTSLFNSLILQMYQGYKSVMEQNNLTDFTNIFHKAIENINQNFNNSILPNLEFIIIDEFQDFSSLYNLLIQAIRSHKNVNLCCVGDDWQAINSYAGSNLDFFVNFDKFFKPATKLTLLTNYRSAKKIVNYTNLIRNNMGAPSIPNSKETGQVFNIDLSYNALNINEIEEEIKIIAMANSHRLPNEKTAILTRTLNQLAKFTNLTEKYPNIIVSTIHSFKGLEADNVIVDLTKNYYEVPHPDAIFNTVLGLTKDKVLEEEARLIYVALTRAKNRLYIVYPSPSDKTTLVPNTTNFYFDKFSQDEIIDCISEVDSSMTDSITIKVKNSFSIKDELKKYNYRYDFNQKIWYKKFDNLNLFNKEKNNYTWLHSLKTQSNKISVEIIDFHGKRIKYKI